MFLRGTGGGIIVKVIWRIVQREEERVCEGAPADEMPSEVGREGSLGPSRVQIDGILNAVHHKSNVVYVAIGKRESCTVIGT